MKKKITFQLNDIIDELNISHCLTQLKNNNWAIYCQLLFLIKNIS